MHRQHIIPLVFAESTLLIAEQIIFFTFWPSCTPRTQIVYVILSSKYMYIATTRRFNYHYPSVKDAIAVSFINKIIAKSGEAKHLVPNCNTFIRRSNISSVGLITFAAFILGRLSFESCIFLFVSFVFKAAGCVTHSSFHTTCANRETQEVRRKKSSRLCPRPKMMIYVMAQACDANKSIIYIQKPGPWFTCSFNCNTSIVFIIQQIVLFMLQNSLMSLPPMPTAITPRPEPATDIFFGNFHTTGWNKRLPWNIPAPRLQSRA